MTNIQTAEFLERIGLTNQESRTYLALMELQEAGSSAICKRTGIASSNIYAVLESLISKGLASYRVQNNVKIFMPSPPEVLNELFVEKQKRLEEERQEVSRMISQLKRMEPTKAPCSDYKYYEGLRGVKAMWHEINAMVPKMTNYEIIRNYTSKPEGFEKLVKFYDEHHRLRKKHGIRERLIYPLDKDGIALARRRTDKITETRLMKFGNYAEWGTAHGCFYIQYITGRSPRSFLIRDETFAQTFEQVYDQLWERSRTLSDQTGGTPRKKQTAG
ncbi:hypothetical protein AUJ14_03350 [Candidatus Micrarchaeota archaeon CG1_02_55_22]|nr:MAG: hypothetical protein AUJ14_03350 [Candidatus Micrarchaeota archaeon CG1_02_55_22]